MCMTTSYVQYKPHACIYWVHTKFHEYYIQNKLSTLQREAYGYSKTHKVSAT